MVPGFCVDVVGFDGFISLSFGARVGAAVRRPSKVGCDDALGEGDIVGLVIGAAGGNEREQQDNVVGRDDDNGTEVK